MTWKRTGFLRTILPIWEVGSPQIGPGRRIRLRWVSSTRYRRILTLTVSTTRRVCRPSTVDSRWPGFVSLGFLTMHCGTEMPVIGTENSSANRRAGDAPIEYVRHVRGADCLDRFRRLCG